MKKIRELDDEPMDCIVHNTDKKNRFEKMPPYLKLAVANRYFERIGPWRVITREDGNLHITNMLSRDNLSKKDLKRVYSVFKKVLKEIKPPKGETNEEIIKRKGYEHALRSFRIMTGFPNIQELETNEFYSNEISLEMRRCIGNYARLCHLLGKKKECEAVLNALEIPETDRKSFLELRIIKQAE
ncbi:MAG TPA: hypothetical protein ENN30_01150 [Candidatus Woesearchaeota archaeon]|mgnify:CR=1 FL=1|nr:hypothetical protein [Candidatus Woesearchaeota archaeon]